MLRLPDAFFQKNFLPGGFGFGFRPLHFVLSCHIFWPAIWKVLCTSGMAGINWLLPNHRAVYSV